MFELRVAQGGDGRPQVAGALLRSGQSEPRTVRHPATALSSECVAIERGRAVVLAPLAVSIGHQQREIQMAGRV